MNFLSSRKESRKGKKAHNSGKTNFSLNKKTKKSNNSIIRNIVLKQGVMREKEFEKHKHDSIKLSVFVSLFVWLIVGTITRQMIFSGAISLLFMTIIFFVLIQLPVLKRKKHSRKVEAELPLFVINLVSEMRAGKDFLGAMKASCKEKGFASEEYAKVVHDVEKGASVSNALKKMNERLLSMNIRRVNSNLSNVYSHGEKNVVGLKKIADELLLKQRIASKEFSGKMVVYALVFIAVSAIVPAMFQSFILIGSYFMTIQFSALEVFIIIVIVFPAIDLGVLAMINSKTPLFLRG